MAFHAWVNRPPQAVLEVGERSEKAQQSADESYYSKVLAPPCVACGQPVSDADFQRHRYERHGGNEAAVPWGKPTSRELVICGVGSDDMEEKVARWRRLHPGVHLEILGDGHLYGGKLAWMRFRVLDHRGRLGR